MTPEDGPIWTPSHSVIEAANLTHYRRWLRARKGLAFPDYPALWHWSVTEPGAFWQSLWQYFDVRASAISPTPLASAAMPGAQWFPGARLNFAENVLHRMTTDQPAIYFADESGLVSTLTRDEVSRQTAALAHTMRELGVGKGDRVVACLPNIPEAMVACLATASLGAIWSSCSPDFGSRSVLDRFGQIEPTLLLAVDGYRYGGKTFDRRPLVAEIQAALPRLLRTILVSRLHADGAASTNAVPGAMTWAEAIANGGRDLPFEQVPFDHPLWILYTSGTTGPPKAVVQGHGGILLEHLKATTFHSDLKGGDRFFWYTSTGWMMWNYLMGGLLSGSAVVLYDGSPAWPDMHTLWRLADEVGITYFGTSAAFVAASMKAGVRPRERADLSRLRALGSTGSPLTEEGFRWIHDQVGGDVAIESMSGGTDLCTAIVGGVRTQPVYVGEIQGASLGAKVEAFDESGRPVVNDVGELVITAPMPSMPLFFWSDPDMVRYRASYFDVYPGVWRHGDWIRFNDRGGCVIYGRSDATIKRHGVRMGTSELYQAIESLPEIQDSLIVDLELLGRESSLQLFVVMREGRVLNDDVRERIRRTLREQVSPRHVPDGIRQIAEVPYTLSGKKMEVPVRRILLGMEATAAANPGAMRNPAAMDYFREIAAGPTSS